MRHLAKMMICKLVGSSIDRVILTLLLIPACLLTGCSSTKQYQAEKLPMHFQAPPLANAQTLDLTKLATSTTATDLIGEGDVVEVSISAGLSADDTATFPVRVAENGFAQLPIIGSVDIKGMDLEGAEAVIAGVCIDKGLYKSPHVTVMMKHPKVNRVTVLGAVEKPATYELRAGQSDVLQAIVAAGGLSESAGTFVQIRQPGMTGAAGSGSQQRSLMASQQNEEGNILQTGAELQVQTLGSSNVRINLASAATKNPTALRLRDGGVVMIERRDPKPIHVLGLVAKPDRYEFPVSEDLRLLDSIALASGTKNPFADKVFVVRNNPKGGERILIEASIKKAKRNRRSNIRLAPGDLVTVEQTPSTAFFDVVSLIGFGVSARAF